MKKEKLDLIYAALFHNLGRIVSRSQGSAAEDLSLGRDWLQKQLPHLTFAEDGKVGEIMNLADSIASGLPEKASLKNENIHKPLADIFNAFGKEKGHRYQEFEILRDDIELRIGSEDAKEISQDDYKKLLQQLAEELRDFQLNEVNIPALLSIWDSFFSRLPLVPGDEELGDISLAEHSRLTAGFAVAIFDYIEGKQEYALPEAPAFYDEKAFLLASFDLSGIQDFIYNIASKGAAKQLKARSLYLDFMSEHIVDSLLAKLELSRANALYVGGGHAYFILSNTEAVISELEEFEKEFNDFLCRYFQTGLYVAFGWSAFAAHQVMKTDALTARDYLASYRDIYQQTSRMISEKKISRYDATTLLDLNKGGQSAERECEICHSVEEIQPLGTGDDAQYLCSVCRELMNFSRRISNDRSDDKSEKSPINYFQIIQGKEEAEGLSIGPGACLKAVSQKDLDIDMSDRLYIKNHFGADKFQAAPLFVGDYAYATIDAYAQLAQNEDTKQGIRRMAVVRLDVDDLGAAFMAGFARQDEGKYSTFARSAAFSQQMSLFFKFYINQFASEKKMTIIYAGGDDVFAIGTWQDIITFTVELRQQFLCWTDGKLKLSAGIGLFTAKTPIHLMADYSGELEEAAKDNEKDSLSLFEKNFTLKFDRFIDKVYQDKLVQIRRYFNSQDERGKAFIYRLIDLLRHHSRMNTARLAYYLARLEDVSKNKEHFREFKTQFFGWYNGEAKERKEVELALLLYVYETRKD